MKRKKTFVASLMKAYLYVEVKEEGDLVLDEISCSKVATIKNGKSATVEIPNDALTVFIVYDKMFPRKYNTSYKLAAGETDVILYTKAHLNPFKGNPFKITED